MKKKLTAFFFMIVSILLFFISCNHPQKGSVDINNNLIIYEYKNRVYSLENNYGMMIYYSEYLGIDFLRIELFDNNKKTITKYHSITNFLNDFRSISNGNILDLFDTCTCSTYGGFQEKYPYFMAELSRICEQKGILLNTPESGSENILCTCGSDHLKRE